MGVEYFFFVCILLPNIVFYFTWAWNTYIEMLRNEIKKGRIKRYTMYTLGCWKLEKFKKRYMPEVESLDIEKTEEERSSDADEEIDHNEIDVELEEQIKEDKEDEEDKNLKKLFANFNKKDRFNDS
jgi:hypothetical protein